MAQSDWANNYSFLLQDIENHINDNLIDKRFSSNNGSSCSTSKKTNITDDDNVFESPVNENIYSDNVNNKKRKSINESNVIASITTNINTSYSSGSSSKSSNVLESGSKLRSLLKTDELIIENEQLHDELTHTKSESIIMKQEFIRQIRFLEEQNKILKKESSDRLEKYYEEKKGWQVKYREMEMNMKKLSSNTSIVASSSSSSSSSSTLSIKRNDNNNNNNITTTSHDNIIINEQLKLLEKELRKTTIEAKSNLNAKIELESKLYQTEQELKILQSSNRILTMENDIINDNKELRQQYSELECNYKRILKDHEIMKTKLTNQILLEEDISSLKGKLRIADETAERNKNVYTDYKQLYDEKILWIDVCRSIVEQSNAVEYDELLQEEDSTEVVDIIHQLKVSLKSNNESGGSSNSSRDIKSLPTISPSSVMHLLSIYQQKCLYLLQGQGKLQNTLIELRNQIKQYKIDISNNHQDIKQLQEKMNKSDSIVSSYKNQNQLYQNEINNLRALLETYDIEFNIGKPEKDRILMMKDDMINTLRKDLDYNRNEAMTYADRLHVVEATIEEYQHTITKLNEKVTAADEKVVMLTRDNINGNNDNDDDNNNSERKGDHQQLNEAIDEMRDNMMYIQAFTGLDFIPQKTKVGT